MDRKILLLLIEILKMKLREILFEEPCISSVNILFSPTKCHENSKVPSITYGGPQFFLSGVKILCSFLFLPKISLVSDGNKIAKTKNSPVRGQVLTGAYQFFLFFFGNDDVFSIRLFFICYIYIFLKIVLR